MESTACKKLSQQEHQQRLKTVVNALHQACKMEQTTLGTEGGREGEGEREREWEREGRNGREREIILLSGLWPITTGVNIQGIQILVDPVTDFIQFSSV